MNANAQRQRARSSKKKKVVQDLKDIPTTENAGGRSVLGEDGDDADDNHK